MALVPHRSISLFATLLIEPGGATGQPPERLASLAREWAPRVETIGPGFVLLEASGLARLFGSPATWAQRLAAAARDQGWPVRVAVAGTRIAAILLALGRRGITVVDGGREAAALAPLSLEWLAWLDVSGFERAPARPPLMAPPSDPRPAIAARSRRPVSTGRHYRLAPTPDQRPGRPGPGPAPATSQAVARHARTARAEAEALLETLCRWGLATLGDLAALSASDVASRLGDAGRRWHDRARGIDARPLADDREERRFEAAIDLEWPIEGLEPLSFVLARLLEPLCVELLREERGAVLVHTRLDLVTKSPHTRTLQLPAPMHDARVLRTLVLLDLEVHPPDAGIDRVAIRLEPAPGRRVQFALFRRPLPSADQVTTLLARLNALMGEGRSGSPSLIDTHRPGAFVMTPFAPRDPSADHRRSRRAPGAVPGLLTSDSQPGEPRADGQPRAVLRRLRDPVVVQVAVRDGRPIRLETGTSGWAGGVVDACAGPWRTSGDWWHPGGWHQDEWDVVVREGPVYRLFCDHASGIWAIEGTWD